MIDQERPAPAPAETTLPGTTVTTGRRGWWRSTVRPERPARPARRAEPARPDVPRSTGIVELRDVARQGSGPDARGARIACDASDGSRPGDEAGVGAVSEVPGGEAPRRRLRWFGWISRGVIHGRGRP